MQTTRRPLSIAEAASGPPETRAAIAAALDDGLTAWNAGEADRTVSSFERALFLTELLSDDALRCSLTITFASALGEFGRTERASRTARAALAAARRAGSDSLSYAANVAAARIAVTERDFALANEILSALPDSPAAEASVRAEGMATALHLKAAAASVDAASLAPSDETIERIARCADARAGSLLAAAFAADLFRRDDPRSARRVLSRAMLRGPKGFRCRPFYLQVARLGASGDVDAARACFEPHADLADLALFNAILAFRRGDVVELRRQATTALGESLASGPSHGTFEARELLEASDMRRTNRGRCARDEAQSWSYDCDDGELPRKGRERPVLTARQAEIASLAASGYRNRDIAARLDISENTVERHVDAILRRRGLSSRLQLSGMRDG